MIPSFKTISLLFSFCVFSLLLIGQTPGPQSDQCISFIPNAISPNGDGINDAFEIRNACQLPKFRLSILNPRGETVFESTQATIFWDGTQNGQLLPEGYYRWVLSYLDPNSGEAIERKGEFALLR